MARARNPKRDESKLIWLKSDGVKPLVEIAKELDCSPSQIRKWKSLDKWDTELKGSAPIEKERYQSMKGNSNAGGNKGNSRASPPKGNQNAVTHGLFAKYLPDETREIMNELIHSDPSDIIWNNIMIQYTAIIRAQQIMYVEDRDDLSNEESGYTSGSGGHGRTYAVQYAWDKQANFLAAQSRAMGTLSSLIRQFVSIADESDERRKRLKLIDRQIAKIDAELSQSDTTEEKLDELLNAVRGAVDDAK